MLKCKKCSKPLSEDDSLHKGYFKKFRKTSDDELCLNCTGLIKEVFCSLCQGRGGTEGKTYGTSLSTMRNLKRDSWESCSSCKGKGKHIFLSKYGIYLKKIQSKRNKVFLYTISVTWILLLLLVVLIPSVYQTLSTVFIITWKHIIYSQNYSWMPFIIHFFIVGQYAFRDSNNKKFYDLAALASTGIYIVALIVLEIVIANYLSFLLPIWVLLVHRLLRIIVISISSLFLLFITLVICISPIIFFTERYKERFVKNGAPYLLNYKYD